MPSPALTDSSSSLLREVSQSTPPDSASSAEDKSGKKVRALKNPIGTTLWGYEVIEEIGRGAMGVVYKARQKSMNRLVALKLLPNRLAKKKDWRERFVREAQAAGKLMHPNLVTVHDVGRAHGIYFIAMEYVDGRSTKKRLKKHGPFSESDLLRLAEHVGWALRVAHEEGIIHRDVKPDNILMQKDGRFRLVDMGLARLMSEAADETDAGESKRTAKKKEPGKGKGDITELGKAVGTPNYMAPEQVRGPIADPRCDLYSLGATIYTLASGRTPYRGGSGKDVLRKVLREDPPCLTELAPHLSGGLIALVERLMARDPEKRFATAEALLDALREPSKLVEDERQPTKHVTTARAMPGVARRGRSRDAKPRRSLGMPLFALLICAALVGFVLFLPNVLDTFLAGSTQDVASSEEANEEGKTGPSLDQIRMWNEFAGAWFRSTPADAQKHADEIQEFLVRNPDSPFRKDAADQLKLLEKKAKTYRRDSLKETVSELRAFMGSAKYGEGRKLLNTFIESFDGQREADRVRDMLASLEGQIERMIAREEIRLKELIEQGETEKAKELLRKLGERVGEDDARYKRLVSEFSSLRLEKASLDKEPRTQAPVTRD